jgi:uncharacterized protein YybS (DUF2232 family)
MNSPPESDPNINPHHDPSDPEDSDWLDEKTLEPTASLSERVPIALVETAFLASAVSLIWLMNTYFPIGSLLRFFFPIPITLVYLRRGSRAGWMATLVSGLLLTVLMGPTRSILFVMPFGFLGVLLGWLWHRGRSWNVSMILGTVLGSCGLMFRVWLLSVLAGDNLWLYINIQIKNWLEWLFLQIGWLTQPDLLLIQVAAIGMIVLNNLLYLFVVHLLAYWLFERLGNPIPEPPEWVKVLLDE